MMYTMYMIVTKDRFRLPRYWGETKRELAKRSGRNYETIQKGFCRLKHKDPRKTEYEVVRFSDDEENLRCQE